MPYLECLIRCLVSLVSVLGLLGALPSLVKVLLIKSKQLAVRSIDRYSICAF